MMYCIWHHNNSFYKVASTIFISLAKIILRKLNRNRQQATTNLCNKKNSQDWDIIGRMFIILYDEAKQNLLKYHYAYAI